MKKLFIPVLLGILLPIAFSCSSSRSFAGYTLHEKDAALAIRQLLEAGIKDAFLNGAFNRETILSALFPEPVKKTLSTLEQLGLTNEIERFTNALDTAAEKTATASVPIFVNGINNMKVNDAVRIIKSGGTSAIDYLKSSVGDSLRRSITPVMQASLNVYHLNEQWEKITRPAKTFAGNKLNLDLSNLMAGVVSEAMFRKIAEKEKQIRSDAATRSTPLLQKVFSQNWNQ